MSRKRNTQTDHFDLLPFVAILMSTLGCLLFITLSIASVNLTVPTVGLAPTGESKTPVLIDWRKGISTVSRKGAAASVIPWSDAQWSVLENTNASNAGKADLPSKLNAALQEISSDPKHTYALFAVRPSGFAAFSAMHAICQQRNIDVGYYPVGEKDKVKLEQASIKGAK
jgi:hypothetical protein